MVERGCPVSPQQCEDKFNDLNKKYKKMRDVLEGNSFDLVENPNLMELANIPEKSKDDIKKLLTCKQLLYREMCSFYDGDRKYLPHDEILENSVRLALKGKKVKNKSSDMVSRVVRQKNNGENSDFFGGFVHEGREEMMSRFLQLEENKLQMQNRLFELEKEKFEWMKLCKEKDIELQKMKLEIELTRLQNERIQLELKRDETNS